MILFPPEYLQIRPKGLYENFSALVTHAPLLGILQDYIIQYYPRCKKWDISKSNHLHLLIFKVFKNLPNKTVKKKKKNPKKSQIWPIKPGFNAWVGRIPWKRARQPTPVFYLENSQTEEPGGLQFMGSQRVGNK